MKTQFPIPLAVLISSLQLCFTAYIFLLVIFQPSLIMGFVYFTGIVTILIAAGIYQLVITPMPQEAVHLVLANKDNDNIPVIFAHRGAGHDAPENTLAAFREAKKNGAFGIEFDVAFTKDNIGVLFHDDELERTTDGTGNLADYTFDELRKLDASANHPYHDRFKGERIPTFEEGIEECLKLGIHIIIDIKDYDYRAVTLVLEMFKKYKELYKMALVASFYPTVVYQLRLADPNIVAALIWRPRFFSYDQIVNGRPKHSSSWKMALAGLADNIYEWALHGWYWHIAGVSVVLIHKDCLSHEYVRRWQKNGIKILAWTVNHPIEKEFIRKSLQISFITDTLK